MNQALASQEQLKHKVAVHLKFLYPEAGIAALIEQCIAALGEPAVVEAAIPSALWSENDVLLITYGNSIREQGKHPLHTLQDFLHTYLKDVVSAVHILPFFPYSSDDGFAVIDYLRVDPELGDWPDVQAIAEDFKLMVDLVINHASSQSHWFKNFQYGKDPGRDYFFQAEPHFDTSMVVRPRTSALLRAVETADGIKHVWCTFSHDQVDWDFTNPEVLLEFLRIIGRYFDAGAQWVRLDAVAFLWKQLGTSCIHLPQTHEVVKLLRLLLEYKNPHSVLITETNVPNNENLTYFGNVNEAHMIYNFSLPPLVLHALMSADSKYLKNWAMSMPPAPMGCTYLNFTASHDGIGLRPAEGLLPQTEIDALVNIMQTFGGRVTSRTGDDGVEKPYEINISLFDAMKGCFDGTDQWQVQRFLCSQTIMLSLEGIPGFYIHSLFGTPNDLDKLEATQHNRSINRKNWNQSELLQLITDANSAHYQIFNELCRLIRLRRQQPAFHPNATQYTLHLNPQVFAFWRQSLQRDQSIFCLHNLSALPQPISLVDINLIGLDKWRDLISGRAVEDIYGEWVLEPYQCIWLTNRPAD